MKKASGAVGWCGFWPLAESIVVGGVCSSAAAPRAVRRTSAKSPARTGNNAHRRTVRADLRVTRPARPSPEDRPPDRFILDLQPIIRSWALFTTTQRPNQIS
uniref:Secreted protein n=1 Tax=Plectus sambesii TaxID=2011161 RepID=A0A914WEW3_9BILA